MSRIQEALLLTTILLAIAVLSVFDIIPAAFAQYAPLAVVPWIIRRNPSCGRRKTAQ